MTAANRAIELAVSWSGQRNKIVDIYNSMPLPLPRGHKVLYEDQLCATFDSAIFVYLGWYDIVPPECGARQLWRNMNAIGRATGDVKRTPDPGDLIFFGKSQTPDGINHCGIVTDLINNGKTIVYYDIYTSGHVGRHYAPVGYDWICGYAMPDYASKDGAAPQPEPTPEPVAGKIEAGDLVKIREGAVWYKGQNIKASVMKQNWYVIQNKDGRVVLGMNEAETSNITSPIHEEDVILVRKYKAETPAVTDKQVTVSVTVHEETWQLLQIMADGNHWSVGQVIDKLLEDAR